MVHAVRAPLKRLYDWVLHWADTPYGPVALFALAFAESSFFPIPPDVLLIALCVGAVKKSFRFAAICWIGSLLGGLFGYAIGYFAFESVGRAIIEALHYQAYFDEVGALYTEYAGLAIFGAAFSPIPYKVFTIAAGVWHIDVATFIAASAVGRAGRFFLIGALFYFFGARIKSFIDRYFEAVLLLAFVLVAIGFLAIGGSL